MGHTPRGTIPLIAIGLIAALSVLPTPGEAVAQDRPSIRISGGHVYIGGRHAGSIGTARDPNALSGIIRTRLHRIGDPRADRFGADRRFGSRRFPDWIHPRQRGVPHAHAPLSRFRPHPDGSFFGPFVRPHAFWPHGFRRPGAGALIVFCHPLGGIFWAFAHAEAYAETYVEQSAPRSTPVGAPRPTMRRPGAQVWEAPPSPRDNDSTGPAPQTGEPRCGLVTVRLVAGAQHMLRVDLRALGAESPEEGQAELQRRLRDGGPLSLTGIGGSSLTVPSSLVRWVDVAPCP